MVREGGEDKRETEILLSKTKKDKGAGEKGAGGKVV